MSTPDFNQTLDRHGTASIKWQRFAKHNALPMWVADMEFATAPEITKALKSRLDHPILGYTTAPEGLVTAVCKYLKDRHHWSIDSDWLTWLPGVVPGISAACGLFTSSDDEILVFTPVYHPLLLIPEKKDKHRVDVPLQYIDNRWTIDFAAFEQSITGNSKALLLCSPHNPAGSVFTSSELRRVVEICAEHNILVVSDEIHCDLVLHETRNHTPTGLAAGDLDHHVLTLMSPSKTFNLAGANCSFAVIPDPEIRRKFIEQCTYNVAIVPTLSYIAAEAAYQFGWDWHRALIEYLRENLSVLKDSVAQTPYLWMDDTEATYLAWINTRDLPVEDPHAFFLNAGVALSPGAQFGNPDYQRLNFACSRDQLNLGLTRISNAIQSLT